MYNREDDVFRAKFLHGIILISKEDNRTEVTSDAKEYMKGVEYNGYIAFRHICDRLVLSNQGLMLCSRLCA
jgi:hypothetical protein